jgi:hypothetical protein
MEKLMLKLHEEAERKAKRTPEEVRAEEKKDKEKLEEQRRVKREREKNTWSSCHLFVGGFGMSRSGSVKGEKVCGEWTETEESAMLKEEVGNGSTAVAGNHPLDAIPSPQEVVGEKRELFHQKPRNPFHKVTNPFTLSARKKRQELKSVDSEDEEIKSRLAPLKLQELAKATSNEIAYERGQQKRNVDGGTVSGITITDNHPLDAIASLEDADEEKKRLSEQILKDHFRKADSNPSTTAKRTKYQFEVGTDEEGEEETVHGETRASRLQELAKATGNEVEGCFYSAPMPVSKNSKVDDSIILNRARSDRIR